MKKPLLLAAILLFGIKVASAQDCCSYVISSVTNQPFKCLSDPNIVINGSPISEFTVGGSSRVSAKNSNGQTQVVDFFEVPKTYGNEIYGFNGKMVRVLTRSILASNPSGYVSPQTYVIDDGCNVVCSWAVFQPICVTHPCYPSNHNSCNNPSFFTSSIKLDYTPSSENNNNFDCLGNTQDFISVPLSASNTLKISKSDLNPGGNTYLPNSGGVITYTEPNHYSLSGAPNPPKHFTGQTYVFNGKNVRVFSYTKIQIPYHNGLMKLAVVLDENCNYIGHWRYNQIFCVTTPCYPLFSTDLPGPFFNLGGTIVPAN